MPKLVSSRIRAAVSVGSVLSGVARGTLVSSGSYTAEVCGGTEVSSSLAEPAEISGDS